MKKHWVKCIDKEGDCVEKGVQKKYFLSIQYQYSCIYVYFNKSITFVSNRENF